jgi:hypothetical protein
MQILHHYSSVLVHCKGLWANIVFALIKQAFFFLRGFAMSSSLKFLAKVQDILNAYSPLNPEREKDATGNKTSILSYFFKHATSSGFHGKAGRVRAGQFQHIVNASQQSTEQDAIAAIFNYAYGEYRKSPGSQLCGQIMRLVIKELKIDVLNIVPHTHYVAAEGQWYDQVYRHINNKAPYSVTAVKETQAENVYGGGFKHYNTR